MECPVDAEAILLFLTFLQYDKCKEYRPWMHSMAATGMLMVWSDEGRPPPGPEIMNF